MAIHLKAARVNAGFTQEDVAKVLAVSRNTIRNYELYKSKPDIETAKKMAALYGMSINDIIFFN